MNTHEPGPESRVKLELVQEANGSRATSMTGATLKVYHQLRERIVHGVYPMGHWLREVGLGDELGAGRGAIRDSLKQLSADQLVEIIPNRGARVRQWSNADMVELRNVRMILEGYAAERAALSISDKDISRLRSLATQMVDLTDDAMPQSFKAADAANDAFHRIVRESGGTTVISNLLSGVVTLPRARRSFAEYPTDVLSRSLAQHVELIGAFESRDPLVARTVMQAHILGAAVVVARSLEAHDGGFVPTVTKTK